MPTALLADDEPLMRAALAEQLQALWPELQIVGEADDGASALLKLETLRPDVAFLDIRMPAMSGLQVAHAMTARPLLVFVTAYDAHAVEAFDTCALDYVLKPLETAKLVKVIAKLQRKLGEGAAVDTQRLLGALARIGAAPVPPAPAPGPQRLQWLQVASARGDQVRMVEVDEVIYFESDAKYTRVVAHDCEGLICEGLIRLSLKEVLERTDAGAFLQTHRSTVVNRRAIKAVHRLGEAVEIELAGRPERLKVSSANHHLFRAM